MSAMSDEIRVAAQRHGFADIEPGGVDRCIVDLRDACVENVESLDCRVIAHDFPPYLSKMNGEFAESFDRGHHRIPCFKPLALFTRHFLPPDHTRRCSSKHNVARFDRHDAGHVADNLAAIEDHLAGVAVLPDFAIYPGAQLQVVWIGYAIASHEPGTQWSKSIRCLPRHELRRDVLQTSGAEVIADRIARNDG